MNYTKFMPKTLNGAVAVTGAAMLAASFPVWAHHPMGGMTPQTFSQGLLSGFGHPIIGLDHLAFLIVAILLSVALKGAARVVVPLAFVGATVGGTALHLGATDIAMSETLVAVSVLIGAVLALTRRYPGALALSALFAVSGVFHGYAYGESIIGAETAPLVAYLIGFSAIQYAMIVGGVLGLEKLAARSEKVGMMAARFSSVLALATGGAFFALSLT